MPCIVPYSAACHSLDTHVPWCYNNRYCVVLKESKILASSTSTMELGWVRQRNACLVALRYRSGPQTGLSYHPTIITVIAARNDDMQ